MLNSTVVQLFAKHLHPRIEQISSDFSCRTFKQLDRTLMQTSPFHFHRRIHYRSEILLLRKHKQLNRFLIDSVHLSSDHFIGHFYLQIYKTIVSEYNTTSNKSNVMKISMKCITENDARCENRIVKQNHDQNDPRFL